MIVKVFLNSAGQYYQHEMLTKFAEGIKKRNQEIDVELDLSDEYSHCDIAVMFGSWKDREKGHHITRSSVAQRARCFIIIETPLLGRQVWEENSQWRVGVNGFLNNQGIFVKKSMKAKTLGVRYNKLNLGNFSGWQNDKDGHILIMLQLPGDASLRRANIYEWARDVISQIRRRTNKRIIVRPHPLANTKDGDQFFEFYYKIMQMGYQNIHFSDSKAVPLKQDLTKAYCSISFSSGSAVDSILNGIPTIACDPGNFAWEISARYPDQIDDLIKVSNSTVEQWLWDLAWHQWSVQEMKTGECWEHIYPICQDIIAESIEHEAREAGKRKK